MKKKKNKSNKHKLKKKIQNIFLHDPSKEITIKSIAKKLKYKGPSSQLYHILKELEKSKTIYEIRRGKYTGRRVKHQEKKKGSYHRLTGRVDQNRSGAAYIIVDGLERDVYIPAKHLRGAMSNDIVDIEITNTKRSGKQEGRVVRIKERFVQDVVARLYRISHIAYAQPLRHIGIKEINIRLDDINEAEEGDIVLLKITKWPEKPNQSPIGSVTKIVNDFAEHELAELNILTKNGFNQFFPAEIEPELASIEKKGIQYNIDHREDYRDVTTFTIDPADAKDFDDALSYDEYDNGDVEIGVHIADVTHYLQNDSILDKEARKRSTSVYLVGRVCPMLPETLSNDLCSLVQGKERLTFAVTFRITPENKIAQYWIRKTVIKSNRRFSYEEAQEIIEGKRNKFRKPLLRIKEFADHLRADRNRKGAINFESEEIRFLLDEKKYPTDIYIKERKDTHLLVEDLMLLANKTVARYIYEKGNGRIPLPYRVHDEPDLDKIADLALMGKVLGFNFEFDNTNQIRKSFNRLYDAAQKNDAFQVLEKLGVRSMAKAMYTTDNIGHFGLAFPFYAHFTSPIRRYADVLVHRVVHAYLQSEPVPYSKSKLEAMCAYISRRERLALDAERESIKLKQAEYMEQFEGERFIGKISGMIDRGIFVSLDNGIGEGMVPFNTFLEPFDLHRNGFSARGLASGKIFALGDRVQVRVVEVDIENRKINLEMVE